MDPQVQIGSVVVPRTNFGITRNYDYFHPETCADERASGAIEPYVLTKPLDGDQEVHDQLCAALEATRPPSNPNHFQGAQVTYHGNTINASADRLVHSLFVAIR